MILSLGSVFEEENGNAWLYEHLLHLKPYTLRITGRGHGYGTCNFNWDELATASQLKSPDNAIEQGVTIRAL